ncbi:MAG: ABC transporter permease [Armatimonadetes bacterium]|nr:ABC transporter permease [Anaerolineae bacterium]
MTAMTSSRTTIDSTAHSSASMPFIAQVITLTWRTLVTNFRVPAAIIPSLIISVFFLFVYDASLSGAARFFLPGQSYLAFTLPLAIVSAALSGSGVAGQSIVRDIESGYFDKLMLTPVNRGALLLGPMIAGAIILVLQTALIIGVAWLLGLESATGGLGLLAVIGIALLLGVGFSGFTVGVALQTGSAAATQGAGFLFFPLSFLTATFVPIEQLTGWIKVAATYNPITYILEAMRAILLTGWETEIILRGISSCLVLAIVLFAWSWVGLRTRTQRK